MLGYVVVRSTRRSQQTEELTAVKERYQSWDTLVLKEARTEEIRES